MTAIFFFNFKEKGKSSSAKFSPRLFDDFFEGSYFAGKGNLPIFMANNGRIVYLVADIKKIDENGNINLDGRKMVIFNIIVTHIG